MAYNFRNYCVVASVDTSTGEPIVEEKLILNGTSNGTIVKTLEIISGNESSVVKIMRRNAAGTTYSTITIELKANDYLLLWEGFIVIPSGHKLVLSADSNEVTVVANVVEMTL